MNIEIKLLLIGDLSGKSDFFGGVRNITENLL